MKNHKTLKLVAFPDSSYIKKVDIDVDRIAGEMIITFGNDAQYSYNLSGLSDEQWEYIVRGMYLGDPLQNYSVGKFFIRYVRDNNLINARKVENE